MLRAEVESAHDDPLMASSGGTAVASMHLSAGPSLAGQPGGEEPKHLFPG